MGMMDKIKNLMGAPEDEEYADDYSYAEQGDYQQTEPAKEAYAVPARTEAEHPRSDKTLNINSNLQLQVVLVKPERFEDAAAIADHLNSKRTVVLNLESTTKEVSRRLVDFLAGAAYANNGQIKPVANSTFIITPYNVDIMGDLLEELDLSGIRF